MSLWWTSWRQKEMSYLVCQEKMNHPIASYLTVVCFVLHLLKAHHPAVWMVTSLQTIPPSLSNKSAGWVLCLTSSKTSFHLPCRTQPGGSQIMATAPANAKFPVPTTAAFIDFHKFLKLWVSNANIIFPSLYKINSIHHFEKCFSWTKTFMTWAKPKCELN